MRIGIDARILQGQLRGQGQYVKYLVKHLLRIDAESRYVLFYNGFRKGPFAFQDERLRQVWSRVPGRLLWSSWENLGFPNVESLAGQLDVFHNTFNFNFTHYTPVPSRCPMVATFHGMTEDPAQVWKDGPYDFRKLRRWYGIIAARARRVIAVSEVARRTLLQRVAIDEKKIKVIYCGVDESFRPVAHSPQRRQVLERYGLEGKEYILYVGTAEPNKNINGLIDAFERLRERPRYRDLYLVLVGDRDANYSNIFKQVSGRNIVQRLVNTGYVCHEHLPSIYSAARLFVLPTFDEWFGIPLVEAMACDAPVVSSSGGAAREVVADAGLLFDPRNSAQMADTIARVLDDPGLADDLRLKGRLQAKRFSWERAAEQTLEVYREAVQA